jgi:ribose 5-phosphate isomerase B
MAPDSNAIAKLEQAWRSIDKLCESFTELEMSGESMKIAIGSDHAGFQYKEHIKVFLIERGETVQDCGTNSEASVDYPPIMRRVAMAVAGGDCDRGIVLGGSGNGEAIVANRVKGIRCALCWSVETAKLAREHNNANMISMGQRLITLDTALDIVRTWLETPFEGGRHARRIQQIDQDD